MRKNVRAKQSKPYNTLAIKHNFYSAFEKKRYSACALCFICSCPNEERKWGIVHIFTVN